MDMELIKLEARKMELQSYTFGNELIGEHSANDVKKKIVKLTSKRISIGERIVISLLEEQGVYYKVEEVFDSSKKRFDFYLPKGIDNQSSPIAIEVNGLQHYKDNNFYSSNSKESDKYKEEYCSKNNIRLIFIDCSKSSFKYITDSIANDPILHTLLEGVKVKNIHRKYFDKKFRQLSIDSYKG